jgi:hypothetical protein
VRHRIFLAQVTAVQTVKQIPVVIPEDSIPEHKNHSPVPIMSQLDLAHIFTVWMRTGRPGDPGSIPGRGKVFSSSLCVQTSSEAHPASYAMGTGGPFPRGKGRPEGYADHSPPPSAEVMSRSYTSSPPCASIGMLWDCFTFYTSSQPTYLFATGLLLLFMGWYHTRRPIHYDHYWFIVLPHLSSNY